MNKQTKKTKTQVKQINNQRNKKYNLFIINIHLLYF